MERIFFRFLKDGKIFFRFLQDGKIFFRFLQDGKNIFFKKKFYWLIQLQILRSGENFKKKSSWKKNFLEKIPVSGSETRPVKLSIFWGLKQKTLPARYTDWGVISIPSQEHFLIRPLFPPLTEGTSGSEPVRNENFFGQNFFIGSFNSKSRDPARTSKKRKDKKIPLRKEKNVLEKILT